MADNKQLPPTGTGTADIVVATDEIAGVDYQKIKLVDGTADSTTGAKVSSEGNLQTITPVRTATGTITALDGTVEINTDGMSIVGVDLTGTWAATVNVQATRQGSPSGSDWFAISAASYDGVFDEFTSNTHISVASLGYRFIRVIATLFTSGTIQVDIATQVTGASVLSGPAGEILDVFPSPPAGTSGFAGSHLQAKAATYLWNATGPDWRAAEIAAGIGDGDTGLTMSSTAGEVFNGTNWDRARSVVNGQNTTGTGVQAAGILGQYDDASTGAVTENQFAPVRISSRRAMLVEGVASGTAIAVTQSGTWDEVGINDSGNSITVDQATGSNLHTVVDSGTVTAVTSITNPVTVAGGAAHASPVSGNPNLVAGRASTAVPTDVGADGDAASLWTQRNGALVGTMAPHVGLVGSPWTLASKTAQYTGTQTSAVLLAGGASDRIVVTKVQIQVGGTTAGTLQLYFGTGAYSRGTSFAIFDGEFAPSATLKPGVVMDGPFIAGTVGDDVLVTDSAAINPLTITIWYYLVT